MSSHTQTTAAAQRVLLHDYGAYPFTLQLARTLAGRGRAVLYLHGGALRRPRADVEIDAGQGSLHVQPVAVHEPAHTAAGLRRLIQERRYGRALADQIRDFGPDAVISTGALDIQEAARNAANEAGAAFVLWLQDLYSEAIARLVGRRLPVVGRLVRWRFRRLERDLARRSDSVVVITEDFAPVLRSWGVTEERVAVIENWAPLHAGPPRKEHAWAREHQLDDRPLLLYAGTLGRKHDPSLLVSMAHGAPDARVVVVAEGVGVDRLRRSAPPPNLVLLPLQPADRVADMLASADVLVALLEADAGVFSVPSKILTYLAAGRPILAAVPADNLAARTITGAGAGYVVDPSDHAGLAELARTLLEDEATRERLGSAGRMYAERAFNIDSIADAFETVISRACTGTNRRVASASHTAGTRGAP